MNNSIPFILLVDDDEDDHYLLKSAIKEVIALVRTYSLYDGSEAIKYLTTALDNGFKATPKPDVIFMDLNMAKLNGMETSLLIKSNPELKEIPIIILTTASDAPEKEQLLNLVQAYYAKPALSKELKDIIIEVRSKFLF